MGMQLLRDYPLPPFRIIGGVSTANQGLLDF